MITTVATRLDDSATDRHEEVLISSVQLLGRNRQNTRLALDRTLDGARTRQDDFSTERKQAMTQNESVTFTLTADDIVTALTNFVNTQEKTKTALEFKFTGWKKKSGQMIAVVAEVQAS